MIFCSSKKKNSDADDLKHQMPGVEIVRRQHGRNAQKNPADDVVNRRRADGHRADGGALQFHFQKDSPHDRQRGNRKRDA